MNGERNPKPVRYALARSICVALVALLAIGFFWKEWMDRATQEWQLYESEPPEQVSKLQKLALVGDSFGSLNALLSGLAVVGVVFTIYRQHLDGKESDIRHSRELREQERMARIATLQALVAHSNDSLDRLSKRHDRLLLLLAYHRMATYDRTIADEGFLARALSMGENGAELIKGAIALIPSINEKSSWKDAMAEVERLSKAKVTTLNSQIEVTEQILKDSLAELGELLGAQV